MICSVNVDPVVSERFVMKIAIVAKVSVAAPTNVLIVLTQGVLGTLTVV